MHVHTHIHTYTHTYIRTYIHIADLGLDSSTDGSGTALFSGDERVKFLPEL
jgi:hypothetical protein